MGMVKFGDKLGETGWELLSRCCSVNGQILKPSKPIGLTDIDLHGNGEVNTGLKHAKGSLRWQTYSDVELVGITGVNRLVQNIIMTWNLTETFALPVTMLENGGTPESVLFQSYPFVSGCQKLDTEV